MGDGAITQIGQTAARLTRRAVLLSAAALPLAGCWLFSGGEWNKKITVTVTTPNGEVSGSVVRWEKMTEDPVLSSAHSEERGEAVVVEVSKGRYLFALIENNKPQDELLYFPGEAPLKSTGKLNQNIGQSITVPPSMYPMLVSFKDINDPNSVFEVKPNNLASAFGAGYSLKSITLEVTDEPVTEGKVEAALVWMNDYQVKSWRLNGKRCVACPDDGTFAESIGTGMFRQGTRK